MTNIRPDYYRGCGPIGRRILEGFLTEDRLKEECLAVITEEMGNDFNIGSALKYLWRAGKKTENPLEDLQKARFYLERYATYCHHKSIEKLIQNTGDIIDDLDH